MNFLRRFETGNPCRDVQAVDEETVHYSAKTDEVGSHLLKTAPHTNPAISEGAPAQILVIRDQDYRLQIRYWYPRLTPVQHRK
jgi:hypothetical protein